MLRYISTAFMSCCRYLAAKCLAEVEEWDECITLLGDGELDDDLQDAVGGNADLLLILFL
jgi:hypothetical protein